MFTGIVEEVGEVVEIVSHGDAAVLHVRTTLVAEGIEHGASIAVNGVCLTVVDWNGEGASTVVEFDVMGETLKRTSVGSVTKGDKTNLERAVRVDGRLGGHIVQGHVDGTGIVVSRVSGTDWDLVRFALPGDLARYVAEKGSIAIEGVSLTVVAVGADWFEVGLIPETLRATTLGGKVTGDPVNLEVDVLAKYVARLQEMA